MHKFAIAAVAAAALFGTAASAQMTDTRTTVQTPVGTATTTTRTMDRTMTNPAGTTTMQKTTVRTHQTRRTGMHNPMAKKSKRHCKTWWNHGRKLRSCKTMMRKHM